MPPAVIYLVLSWALFSAVNARNYISIATLINTPFYKVTFKRTRGSRSALNLQFWQRMSRRETNRRIAHSKG